jgi:hypothetical protein
VNQHQTTAAYRTMQRRRQELYDSGAVDDSRMDKWLITGVVAVCCFLCMRTVNSPAWKIDGVFCGHS